MGRLEMVLFGLLTVGFGLWLVEPDGAAGLAVLAVAVFGLIGCRLVELARH